MVNADVLFYTDARHVSSTKLNRGRHQDLQQTRPLIGPDTRVDDRRCISEVVHVCCLSEILSTMLVIHVICIQVHHEIAIKRIMLPEANDTPYNIRRQPYDVASSDFATLQQRLIGST